jgi:AcrR family transcriptional regulator
MGRRREIFDAAILQAAREVFLGRGVHATTREVAQRANISEASVFKRFKTKGELFCAAMRPNLEIPTALATLPERAGQGSLADALEEAGRALLDVMRVVLPTMMMSWSSGIEGPPEVEGLASQRETLKPLVDYVGREMKRGRLRAGDPEIFARALLGGIADYVVTETLRRGTYPTALSPDKYIRGLVDLILNGAVAPPPPSKPPSPRTPTKPSKRRTSSKKG